jgi:hypothetical protein
LWQSTTLCVSPPDQLCMSSCSLCKSFGLLYSVAINPSGGFGMESHYQPGSMERPQDQDLSAPCPDRQSRYTLKPVGAFVPCIFENWGVSSKLSIAGKSRKERGACVHVKLTRGSPIGNWSSIYPQRKRNAYSIQLLRHSLRTYNKFAAIITDIACPFC